MMRPVDALRIVLGFCLAIVAFILPIAVGWMTPMGWRRMLFYHPWLIFSLGVCMIFRIDRRISGRENIRAGFHRRRLFICNHQSALDIPILVSIFPIPFLTKSENLKIPFVGLAGLLAGSVSFNREKASDRRKVIQKIIDRVALHTSLYIFPEGTRSKTGEIQERIYPALLRAAWRANIDVVPIALDGSFWVIGHKQQPGNNGNYPVSINIGPAIEACQFDNDRAFADHCWQQVVIQFRTLRAEPVLVEHI
jgi:1-acyl-sn-glycerol-3-phosphate acyltransferase